MPKIREHYLIQNFLSLALPTDHYAVFGSGPMFAHGIRKLEELKDLDIIVDSKGWEFFKDAFNIEGEYDEGWKCYHMKLFNGGIEVWNGWGPKNYNIPELISRAEVVEGIPFVRIEDVLEWKELMGREKDKEHIRLIKKYLSSSI